MAAPLKVGSTDISEISEYEVDRTDLDGDSTGRSESGVMNRTVIRAGVYTIKNKITVTRTRLAAIYALIAPASFSVTFSDPYTATFPTLTFYAGPKTAKPVKYKTGDEANSVWELTVDFIQI